MPRGSKQPWLQGSRHVLSASVSILYSLCLCPHTSSLSSPLSCSLLCWCLRGVYIKRLLLVETLPGLPVVIVNRSPLLSLPFKALPHVLSDDPANWSILFQATYLSVGSPSSQLFRQHALPCLSPSHSSFPFSYNGSPPPSPPPLPPLLPPPFPRLLCPGDGFATSLGSHSSFLHVLSIVPTQRWHSTSQNVVIIFTCGISGCGFRRSGAVPWEGEETEASALSSSLALYFVHHD